MKESNKNEIENKKEFDIETEIEKINARLDKVESESDLALKESKYAVDKVIELRDKFEFRK
jgi:uncharacterized protein (DUF342 family)